MNKRKTSQSTTEVISLRVDRSLIGNLRQQARVEKRPLANMIRRTLWEGLKAIIGAAK